MHWAKWALATAGGCVAAFCLAASAAEGGDREMKQVSVFYPARLRARARANAKNHPWAAAIRDRVVAAAGPWMKLSDDQLWSLVFGATISRSWMVWSNGHCPACEKSVPMYNWRMAPLKRPWKVQCPHCKELFPKNDFGKYYRSGLDESGVFDPARADRKLLFNVEHPAANDPLGTFGVDDGEGYVRGPKRWRFIGAYLIYAQWKRLIVGGADRLSAAYVVTGDPAYARKAGILLDRVADLYPTFDYATQGLVYETRGHKGYVSTWHDASPEVRGLVIAYDRVFEGLRDDRALVAFLAAKAARHKLANAKATFADVQRNIEQRLLVDTLKHRRKIESNYPCTDVTLTVITSVLDRSGAAERARAIIDRIVARSVVADGMTGEKGLAGYTTIAPRYLSELLERYALIDPAFLAGVLKRHPRLRQTYRFHIDTWCLGKYYPLSGDTGAFARRIEQYVGVRFARQGPELNPSAYSFLWRLAELTGEADFAKVLHHANGHTAKGLPHDIFAADPAAVQKKVAAVIAREGAAPEVGSVNKPQWRLAILRGGRGPSRRALWLDYDSLSGRHSHADGMNLGLFARGLDLMPDFGYPPVQFGGWGSRQATWYMASAAHNTVVVDGANLRGAAGKATLWADGERFRAVRASAPAMIAGKQFERTAAMIGVSASDFYVLDVFRVVGGADHARLMRSHFGKLVTKGLSLAPAKGLGRGALMRNFRADPAAKAPWSATWHVEDRYGYLPKGANVRLRLTDLTAGARAGVAETWIVAGMYGSSEEVWIPTLVVRRRATKRPLASTFVSVIEPYEGASNIARVRRLALHAPDGSAYGDANVAVEVALADGRSDLIVAADVENPLALTPAAKGRVVVQKDWQLRLDGELCMVRRGKGGKVERVALGRGRSVRVGKVELKLKRKADFVEVRFGAGRPAIVAGNPDDVESISVARR